MEKDTNMQEVHTHIHTHTYICTYVCTHVLAHSLTDSIQVCKYPMIPAVSAPLPPTQDVMYHLTMV